MNRKISRYLTKQGVQVALVAGVRDADQDGEEEEGEDGLPHLHLVLGDEDQDDDEPDVGQDGGGRRDAEHHEVANPENINCIVKHQQTKNICFSFSAEYSLLNTQINPPTPPSGSSLQSLPAALAVGDGDHADGGDGEEVVGGRAHDGAGPELVRVKLVLDHTDDCQADLRSRRS